MTLNERMKLPFSNAVNIHNLNLELQMRTNVGYARNICLLFNSHTEDGGGMCTLSEPERDGESICVGISDKDYSCGADVGL